jgi:hypothetical protein
MIDAIAIISGTIARKDANTNASTSSAPKPPIKASRSTPGPSLPPLSSWSASNPVRWTGAPPIVAPSSAARAVFSASGFSPNCESGSGRG